MVAASGAAPVRRRARCRIASVTLHPPHGDIVPAYRVRQPAPQVVVLDRLPGHGLVVAAGLAACFTAGYALTRVPGISTVL
jgi:hypothetical protein